jgi:hypothetical protein
MRRHLWWSGGGNRLSIEDINQSDNDAGGQ